MGGLITFLRLVPTLIKTISAIDKALPARGIGQQKLQMLLTTVAELWESSVDLKQNFTLEKLLTLVTSFAEKFIVIAKLTGQSPK